uniref:Uncharacterized protein n=1 Tax=Kwoniella dejecticola CBS 10117 TaxID=1296121 RepID=A0A1A6A2J9_9TREE|nr:uncharacterized protein I303_05144 [Kwoniella dejecticola CBS 10117]OBR84287.1 hypothetical protein I303_05144 [Kwoniella dejecticola CBS 10117]
MSQQQALPLSYPGPRTGEKFFDHQKAGLSKMLFMENDYRSLYEAMVRHDPSLKDLQYLDLSSFPHSWRHEGGDEWSQDFSDTLGHEEIRPLQGKGMILADEWAKSELKFAGWERVTLIILLRSRWGSPRANLPTSQGIQIVGNIHRRATCTKST